MRVVAGTLRGRPLVAPKDGATRPTADRVREALFNVLAHGIDDFTLDGVHVLDLFAGTGALGIEALSRSAAYCIFIEMDAEARGAIRDNVEAFGLTGCTRIFRRDATDLGPAGNRTPAGLVFLDPPYGKGFATSALTSAIGGGWLSNNAIVVVEEDADAAIDWPDSLQVLDQRTYGRTAITILKYGGAGDKAAGP